MTDDLDLHVEVRKREADRQRSTAVNIFIRKMERGADIGLCRTIEVHQLGIGENSGERKQICGRKTLARK